MLARHLAYSYFNNTEKIPTEKAKIVTAQGKEISIFSGAGLPVTLAQEREYLEAAQRILGGENKIRRTGPASDDYNCHGYTFAKGIGHIMDDDVTTIVENLEVILTSDDSQPSNYSLRIPTGDAIPPFVVYGDDNCHSGFISRIENDNIYINAKDGPYGEHELEVTDYPKLYSRNDKSWKIYRWPNYDNALSIYTKKIVSALPTDEFNQD